MTGPVMPEKPKSPIEDLLQFLMFPTKGMTPPPRAPQEFVAQEPEPFDRTVRREVVGPMGASPLAYPGLLPGAEFVNDDVTRLGPTGRRTPPHMIDSSEVTRLQNLADRATNGTGRMPPRYR